VLQVGVGWEKVITLGGRGNGQELEGNDSVGWQRKVRSLTLKGFASSLRGHLSQVEWQEAREDGMTEAKLRKRHGTQILSTQKKGGGGRRGGDYWGVLGKLVDEGPI